MDTPNVGAGSEELPARRVPKAGYRIKAWREQALKQGDAPVKCGRRRWWRRCRSRGEAS
jgi:hypothetical protein